MEHLVILNLGSGDWDTGFPNVTAQLWSGEATTPLQVTGSLPSRPQLLEQYQRWQQLYTLLYEPSQNWRRSRTFPAFEFEEEDITNVSSSEFFQLCKSLRHELNDWLDVYTFLPIERKLRTQLSPNSHLRIMLVAKQRQLLQFPWNLWNFLEDYPKAEIALSPPDYERSLKSLPPSSATIKILAILGNAEGIDIMSDRQLLEAIPDVELTLLTEPSWDLLSQQLWKGGWDILFFAGHSSSESQGYLQINETERITIAQLKYALRNSIETGLQLAILNSCDGLALAWSLTDLQIPQVIVMREPVPDQVAQEFLKHFLTAFSGDQTLYLAVREAREKLQSLEATFGCASWLPVIVQNPAEHPPTWRSLKVPPGADTAEPANDLAEPNAPTRLPQFSEHAETAQTTVEPLSAESLSSVSASPASDLPAIDLTAASATVSSIAKSIADSTTEPHRHEGTPTLPQGQAPDHRSSLFSSLRSSLLGSLCITGLLLLLRGGGVIAPLELWAFDQLLRLRPHEGADPRLLVVTIDEADIQSQAIAERQVSLSDESLEKLLNILRPASVIGLDLYRDFPAAAQHPQLTQQLQAPKIVGVCKGRDPVVDPTGIAPPPEMSPEQIGFSDFLTDSDGVLRRQIISMTPDPTSPCTTDYAFSTQLVFNYLRQNNVPARYTNEGNLQLGEEVFTRLKSRSGGYQSIDAQGNQVLIHYRSLKHPEEIAPHVSLRQVLNGALNPEAVRDRIILIGVTAPSRGDFWATPYGSGPLEEIPGVFIHAHVVSQMLSTALEHRPLIWVWSPVFEGLWIGGWAVMGAVSFLGLRHLFLSDTLKSILILSGGGMVLITGCSFALLLMGGWAPLVPAMIVLPLSGVAAARAYSAAFSKN